ncbi:hypothetical protein CN964_29800 [Bacillus cereus]|uniref:hypothetical protein n=2 Tax=Bacillus cereus TaxID=1396 RepID=UPI000BF7DD3B|nr:hypothetical protein [Bacillus cereus]PFJ29317.1 hypothetical protein COI90_23625 [Bacillus cereus]PFO23586.1 hypothetical protein COJ80_17450 [Bacillus cereus]PGN65986.1 hypothetical protein CN964_29800 [Bacillus cereus]
MEKERKEKWITIKFLLEKMLIEVFILGLAAFVVYTVIKEMYNVDLILLINSILKPFLGDNVIFIMIFLIIGIIIKYFYKRYKFLEFLDFLDRLKTKYENPKARIEGCIAEVNGEIDSLKLKADILKSFSPVPIILLFIGSVFEKGTFINLNSYSLIVLATVLFYFWWLTNVYNKFSAARRELALYEKNLIKIENPDFFYQKISSSIPSHREVDYLRKDISESRNPLIQNKKENNDSVNW